MMGKQGGSETFLPFPQAADAASEKANRRSEEILNNAKADAIQIKQKAEADIEREKQSARSEIRSEISDLAVMVASKIVDKEINEQDQRRFIDEFIENVGDEI